MSRVADGFFIVLALFSLWVVYATSYVEQNMLFEMTKEMGFYENISVLLLLSISIYGAYFI